MAFGWREVPARFWASPSVGSVATCGSWHSCSCLLVNRVNAYTFTTIVFLQRLWKRGGKKYTMRALRALPRSIGVVLFTVFLVIAATSIPLGVAFIGGIAGAGLSQFLGIGDPQTYGRIGFTITISIMGLVTVLFVFVSLFLLTRP